MKIEAEIEGTRHKVEIIRDGDHVTAEIDGRRYEVEASEPEPNVFLIKHEGKIREVFVSHPESSGPAVVTIRGHQVQVALIDPKRLRASTSAAEHFAGAAEIKTSMPGKVVRILVAEGDQVAKGDGIIVIEAMKMQNELKAPKDGTVKEIRFEAGQTVAAGAILATIE
ncbi:MAG TPA: biotin/lipoyl-containing protein [Pyrinomonadaceae bacterium]|nr:biotin/lipoyl-containing protein [Pyrinomonadaceae bacterium]